MSGSNKGYFLKSIGLHHSIGAFQHGNLLFEIELTSL